MADYSELASDSRFTHQLRSAFNFYPKSFWPTCSMPSPYTPTCQDIVCLCLCADLTNFERNDRMNESQTFVIPIRVNNHRHPADVPQCGVGRGQHAPHSPVVVVGNFEHFETLAHAQLADAAISCTMRCGNVSRSESTLAKMIVDSDCSFRIPEQFHRRGSE
jgi:hypothetical protein